MTQSHVAPVGMNKVVGGAFGRSGRRPPPNQNKPLTGALITGAQFPDRRPRLLESWRIVGRESVFGCDWLYLLLVSKERAFGGAQPARPGQKVVMNCVRLPCCDVQRGGGRST